MRGALSHGKQGKHLTYIGLAHLEDLRRSTCLGAWGMTVKNLTSVSASCITVQEIVNQQLHHVFKRRDRRIASSFSSSDSGCCCHL